MKKEKKSKKDPSKMNAAEQVAFISKAMGFEVMKREPKMWLDTGSRRLNRVVGSPDLGAAYGKTMVFAGDFSSGKTMIATKLLGLAQEDGAAIGYVDVENSHDPVWAMNMGGLDFGKEVPGGYSRVALFQPEVGIFGKTKKQPSLATRLQTAEELFTMAERWMLMQRTLKPQGKRAILVDSTTAIQPEEEMVHGLDDQNMRSRLSLPVFMNLMTKRWNQIALNTNTLVIYVSQIRIDPTAMFGDPTRIPGGKGILFYPHVINVLKRANKGGMIKDSNDNLIGLRTVITNMKNKAGGGSLERSQCGFKAYFNKNKWKFMAAKELKTT